MNVHKNARLTPIGRERIVMQVTSGQTPRAAARASGVCPRTVRKWVARYAALGITGWQDQALDDPDARPVKALDDPDARPVNNRAGWRKGSGPDREWMIPREAV